MTVDYDGLEDGTVTIRDRDSTEQKRVKRTEHENIAFGLATGAVSFKDL